MAFEAFRDASPARARRRAAAAHRRRCRWRSTARSSRPAWLLVLARRGADPADGAGDLHGGGPAPAPPAAARRRRRRGPQETAAKPRHGRAAKTPEIVQPREDAEARAAKKSPSPTKTTEQEQGEKGGVAGGTTGGVAGGAIGGTVGGIDRRHRQAASWAAPGPRPAEVPRPQHGRGAEGSRATIRPSHPSFSRPGAVYRVLAKICVTTTGTVEKITIMKGADPQLDEGVVQHGEILALPPAHGQRDARSVLLPRHASSSGPVIANARRRRQNHGFHAGWTLARDGLHRPRGGRRARRSCRSTRWRSRASGCSTFSRGRKLSRRYIEALAPLVEDAGRLREAVGLDKRFAGSPVASVIGAGLHEYARGTDRRGNQAVRLRGGRGGQPGDGAEQGAAAGRAAPRDAGAGDGRVVGPVRGPVRHRRRHHHRVPEARRPDQGRRRHRHRVGRHRGGPGHHGRRPGRRDRGGLVLQLLHRPPRRHRPSTSTRRRPSWSTRSCAAHEDRAGNACARSAAPPADGQAPPQGAGAGGDQRDPAGRRGAGAAHHLHGHHADDRPRRQRRAADHQPPRQQERRQQGSRSSRSTPRATST